MKILRVGDPHIKLNNLEEANKLMEFVATSAIEHSVDRIELLGDLFHTHAIVRLEVLLFWNDWLDRLSMICETVVLVGNHDQSGDYSGAQNVLTVFKHIPNPNLIIVDKPTLIGPIAYLPYIHHEEDFIAAANALADQGGKAIVCHSTFNGAKYDNGFYAPGGFDFEKLNFPLVISGHIHTRQRFGKVIYPGTAKWDTLSDANEVKGLWLVEHAEDGSIVSEEFIDTSKVVSPIHALEWREGDSQPEIPEGRVTVELIGTSEWVKKQKEKLKGKCGVKSKITDRVSRVRIKREELNLAAFVTKNFEPVTGVDRAQILEYMKELELV